MQKGNKKLFNDKDSLSQMLSMRYNGYALTTLAIFFHCDISSIRFQCDRFHIKPQKVYTVERIVRQVIPKTPAPTYKIVNGERINLGKSYKDYLKPLYY